jgi:hypothetical protein
LAEAAHCNVWVVVDPAYPGRLEDLAATAPVWIVSSAVNKKACQRAWAASGRIIDHHLPGSITLYGVSDPADRASNLLDMIPVLEEHYGDPDDRLHPQGQYLRLPDGFGLSVIGLSLTSELERRLEEFAFESFSTAPTGFQTCVGKKWSGEV